MAYVLHAQVSHHRDFNICMHKYILQTKLFPYIYYIRNLGKSIVVSSNNTLLYL